MNRVRMFHSPEPQSNLLDEIIDLTGDSPVVNSTQIRGPRNRNILQIERTNNGGRFVRPRDDSPNPVFYDPLTSVERDNSYIQIIDPDETQLMARRLRDEQEFENIIDSESSEEDSTAVPCLNDTCTGQQVVLSCPICFEPLVAKRKPMATSCGHIFCAHCLKQTLQSSRNKTCPKCNASVKTKSCIRLYF